MASSKVVCDICDRSSSVCCIESHQFYCDDCVKQHRTHAKTKSHILIKTNPMACKLPGCEHCDDRKDIVKICLVCKDIFCSQCSDRHPRFAEAEGHSLISINEFQGSLCIAGSGAESRPQTARRERSTSKLGGAQVQIATPSGNIKHTYNGKLLSENTCAAPGETKMTRIRGMAFLQDGRLLIIDNGNCCLKMFKGESNEFVTKKELHDEPRGIAYISEDNFAISFAYKKEIVFYKIDKANNIWQQKSIGMPDKPFCISYSKKTLAVEMGEGDDGKIVITDSSGNIKRRVQGPRGFALFTGNSIRIAHENDKKMVYLVNVGGDVYCLSYEGQTIWKVPVPSPRGLALAEDSSILFVASKDSNKIYQITTTSGEVYNFLDENDKIQVPRFLVFNSTKQRLVVEVGYFFNVYEVTEGQKKKT